MASPIPFFYRTWFMIIDPILSVFGVAGNLFAPAAILNSYTQNPVFPPATETAVLLDITTGFFACVFFYQTFLLRAKPSDVTLWRYLRAGVLIVDIFLLGGLVRALISDGRTSWTAWRAEEWTNIGITSGVAVIRTAFLLGIGVAEKGKRRGKRT